MKLSYLTKRLVDVCNLYPDAEVSITVDDATDRVDIEQVVVMECDGTVDVLLCETALMDER
jgi:hypothetical protein